MKKMLCLILLVGSSAMISACGFGGGGCCGNDSCGSSCGSYTVACCGNGGWY